ncbi:MAG: hypothetical protein RL386_438 [Bacteroidota bacterium]
MEQIFDDGVSFPGEEILLQAFPFSNRGIQVGRLDEKEQLQFRGVPHPYLIYAQGLPDPGCVQPALILGSLGPEEREVLVNILALGRYRSGEEGDTYPE